jgi:hypothetical protein
MVEHFTVQEAKALWRDDLYTIEDLKDEHERVLIPAKTVTEVVGIDVSPAYNGEDAPLVALLAIYYDGESGNDGPFLPKTVLIRKDMYERYFENMSLKFADL